MTNQKSQTFLLLVEVLVFVFMLAGVVYTVTPSRVSALTAMNPVGGRFLPGLFDIFTPSLCGLLVSVAGPKPGVFVWAPVMVYDEFYKTFNHVGTNMLGLSTPPLGICPPVLYIVGSSLIP